MNSAKASKTGIYINVLKNVKSSVIELKLHNNLWKQKTIPLLSSSFGSVWLVSANPRRSDIFLVSTGFLENTKLHHYNDVSGRLSEIQKLPPRFKPDWYKHIKDSSHGLILGNNFCNLLRYVLPP